VWGGDQRRDTISILGTKDASLKAGREKREKKTSETRHAKEGRGIPSWLGRGRP